MTDWTNFKRSIICLRNVGVKIKTKKHMKAKWATKKTIKRRRAKLKAWKRYKQDGTTEAYEKYKLKRNKLGEAIREAKHDFEIKLAKNVKKDSKSFYACVNSSTRKDTEIGPFKDNNGNIISDKKEKANLLKI